MFTDDVCDLYGRRLPGHTPKRNGQKIFQAFRECETENTHIHLADLITQVRNRLQLARTLLTVKESEAVALFLKIIEKMNCGDLSCRSAFAKAARELGIDAKSFRDRLSGAIRKLMTGTKQHRGRPRIRR